MDQGAGIVVVGGGLAGAEAAWQAARRGVRVRLWEMRPATMTPAHRTGELAELVCSNSLGSMRPESGAGTLQAELSELDSLIMACAREHAVPAGHALAVDREAFARAVTVRVADHPQVELIRREVAALPPGVAVVATGPLTSPALATALEELTGEPLFFFDAAAPIVTRESLDLSRIFAGSRYQAGGDYLNCPLGPEEYRGLVEALLTAEVQPLKDFERGHFFEGCLPVEELAHRGMDTLRFGPMKPVGLTDPRTGRRPYAVVQLRREKAAGDLYNLVGFQTNLKWGEQARVFRMIPGLEQAEFVRYGVMHRNTYLNSPRILEPTLELTVRPGLFFAGQMTGVEGYLESAATGLLAGINAARRLGGKDPVVPPPETMLGALCRYVAGADPSHFQPMNANFGLLPPLAEAVAGRAERKERLHRRSVAAMAAFARERAE
jgi:methylenetetrahydrofolate--tRNA-(uracil-5-)-methyltransferase